MATYRVKRTSIPKPKVMTKSVQEESPTIHDLPSLRRKRTLAYNRMKKILDVALQAKSTSLPDDTELFLAHYSSVSKLIESFEDAHGDILTLLDEKCEEDEDSYREQFDSMYFDIVAVYSQLTRKSESQSTAPNRPASAPTVKLPKIEIPKFSGNIKSWPEYYDIFNALIHENGSLSNTEKMQYLVSTLSGDALGLIRTFPAQGIYYEEAYRTLVARYRDKRELAFTCWKEMQAVNIKANTPLEFRRVLDTFNENLTILKGLGLPTAQWDFVLCYLLLSKLDSKTRCEFEQAHPTTELPCYATLKDFLYSKCEALVRDTHFSSQARSSSNNPRTLDSKKSNQGHKATTSVFLSKTDKESEKPVVKQPKPQVKSSTPVSSPSSVPASQSAVSVKCSYCNSDHSIARCVTFTNLPLQARADYAKDHHWCFNCLKSSHGVRDCNSLFRCQKCRQKHHTLLHNDDSHPAEDVSTPQEASCHSPQVRVLTSIGDSSVVLLSTAVISVMDSSGQFHFLRALIDCGSQAHFITERAAHCLGLDCIPSARTISGLGKSSASVSGVVKLKIGLNDKVVFNLDALTIPNICGYVPNVRLNATSWQHLRDLPLADPNCCRPGPIDVLLGAEVFSSLLLPGKVGGSSTQPSALNTVFGWILLGNASCGKDTETEINSFLITNEQLYNEVKRLWELDSIPQSSHLSPDEQKCEDIFSNQHSRDTSGRYTVALPFKEGKENLTFPGSRDIALRRFHALERKLNSNPVLKEQYSEFMNDYLQSGHMNVVSPVDLTKGRYYIPHHCVLRPDSATTKLRVVFDASAKDMTGKSLNETLLIGPKLQTNILEILIRFRIHPVVFTSDVRQMYRQILVQEEDRDFQRIFWRSNSTQPVQEYRLNTVTYGVSSAPFLACRAVKQLSEDESDLHLAHSIVQSDMYIDDIVTGFPDFQQALQAKSEIIDLLGRGQMELRKWASNCPELLADLPPEHCLTNQVSMDVEKSHTLKVLGLIWDPQSDTFSFEVKPQIRRCTRRTILSELARIFDPLGFLSPITLSSKILVQKLWILNVSWDDEPPSEIVQQWELMLEQLPTVKSLRIPRCLASPTPVSCQLHGFADSSESGYGAVIYLRCCDPDGNIQVYLVAAKSRVAPTKKVSLPRLELCASVLLADLLKIIKELYLPLLPITDTYAWSDSTVALAWIRSPSCRWKTFVANRVSHIQESIPGANWHHVPSSDNPADVASRGQMPTELVHNSLWWAGPPWLVDSSDRWPSAGHDETQNNKILQEEKGQTLLVNDDIRHFIDQLLERYSSIRKVQRILCYLIRFVHYSRRKDSVQSLSSCPFSRVELHHALLVIVRHVQAQHFEKEIAQLKEQKLLSKQFRKLSPFLDDHGVLRVGGRLSRSGLEFEHKHPALLPRSSRFTYMIIEEIHAENGHPGVNTLLYLLTQQFWLLSPKRAIRHCLSKCLKCYRMKPTPLEPYMSDLPFVRVNQAKPFSIIGTDYGGPFRIKLGNHRGAKIGKAYLCLFVCFSTKAVHLEVVSDLSTDAFLAALRRFVGRRGRVSIIHSDCGTNYVGASNHLNSLMNSAARSEGIEFRFNPPSSPHFGGVWEIQIKAVKTHLYRIVGTQTLNFEELTTLFVQIEAMLNSRPLYPVSSDPNDLTVLTPGHFLTLEPMTTVPDEDYSNLNLNRLGRWQLIQRFQRDFWVRWRNEYLNSLMQRAKWTSSEKPLSVGSVVILKTDSTTPLH
ncbi:uncharacterized protein LOC126370378 [Pectinophora gossypiella]|uniref:uncharacterized protein LOC126370378 n=1 Tax=Pectinophora gossypiella TaxID=13191 RepID=UPI00214F0A14|nr:uncharacterized protein LOC126370378 [Pectinophora gossypiella]